MLTIILIFVGAYIVWATVRGSSRNKTVVKYTDPQTGQSKRITRETRQPNSTVIIEKPDPFEITDEIGRVLHILENENSNLFLTGKAGTGKSTLLRYFRATTKKFPVVVAPTGVAAVNVQGQTIHGFFGWNTEITIGRVRKASYEKSKIYRKMKMLIIDEISMVRADIFQCIDKFLRLNTGRPNLPFGGVQIVAIGDLYQLPPVVKGNERSYIERVFGSPFFFSTEAFLEGNFKKFELNNVFRQTEQDFINALNHIREGNPADSHIGLLNSVVIDEEPEDFEQYVHLVPTNAMAREINEARMSRLSSEAIIYKGNIYGSFSEKDAPTDLELTLKSGARAMLLNNDKKGRWVNGEIVTVVETKEASIIVEFVDNTVDEILPHIWETVQFVFDEEEQKIIPQKTGGFVQIPVKAAWAITIHKSQGKTFEKMFIDLGSGAFAEGQTYVALSRSKSLAGLKLASPLTREDIFVNEHVRAFMCFAGENDIQAIPTIQAVNSVMAEPKSSKSLLRADKKQFVLDAIKNLRKGKYIGIHVVYSGFNKSFREAFNDDPVTYINELVEQKIVYTHLVKGGVMLYDYKEYSQKRGK